MQILSHFTRRRINVPPPAVLAGFYAAIAAAGALLLKLPAAAHGPTSWFDAAFTAVSAVTVTGLVVVDTGSHFTLFGQAVLLVLIQLGGLGLMTFAVLVLSMFGVPIGLPHRIFLKEELNQTSITDLLRLVATILRVVLVCEGIGAVLLAFVFVPEFGWAGGLWQAVFHSVSAFNNAGFSLFPDSLTRYVGDPLVNVTIPALFIVGGLGFSVIADVRERRRWHRFTLHTKLMLLATAVLLVGTTAIFAALEWTNSDTLGALPDTATRLMASWFQGATPRTAGFNTVPMEGLTDASALMMISLMFIGGGSTSTAGGIKVTTVVVLLLATVAFFRRTTHLHAFGRSLGLEEVLKVLALTVVSILVVISGVFALVIFQEGDFLDMAFEVVSAFGTVGVSRGITGELEPIGRIIIMVAMFIGRVGPLTLGFFLATRSVPRIRYPAGHVFLG